MFHKLTALVLAGLLASPFCCCLGGACDDGAAKTAKTNCCSSAPEPEQAPCDCEEKKSFALEATGSWLVKVCAVDHLGSAPAETAGSQFPLSAQAEITLQASDLPPPVDRVFAQHCVWLV